MTPARPVALPLASSVIQAPAWLREPYRLLFPLGVALAWAGVLPWLLHAAGAVHEYKAVYHSVVQVEGFLACFASGFLLTLIPRKSRTPPPRPWQLGFAAGAPVLVALFAWFDLLVLSQLCWLALLTFLVSFAVGRLRKGADLPATFSWVFVGLAAGLCGTLLTALRGLPDGRGLWLHEVGRGLVLQGVFSGLIVGTGGMLVPAISRGAPFAQGGGLRRMLPHLLLGGLFIASFFVEPLVSFSLGFGLRAAAVAAALIPAARLWEPPTLSGLHRRLVWVAAWMLPLGFAFVALFPQQRSIGLHLVFIGSFALIALSVAVHVVLSHGGWSDELRGSPWSLRAMALLLLLSLCARLAVGLAPAFRLQAIGSAAALFLVATICWAALVLPRLRERAKTASR